MTGLSQVKHLDEMQDDVWARLEENVSRFEDAWLRGQPPSIDEFVAAAEVERQALLIELVYADLECRLKSGEAIRVERYLAEYPTLAGDRETVLDLIASEHRLRSRSEPDVTVEEFCQRFPNLRDELPLRLKPNSAPPLRAARREPSPISRIREAGDGSLDRAEQPHPNDPIGAVNPSANGNSARRIPRVIDEYELGEEIARGGMGVVYRARQIGLNRTVAVKLLRDQLADHAKIQRFLREAETAAKLYHRNIVSIHGVGQVDGLPYLSMEYIEGSNLSALLSDGPLAAEKAAGLLKTVAEAIQYMHEQGILHRDLKPSNVLIDAHGQPHVTDFGLAALLERDSRLTATGDLVGTPAYMSPEQASGEVSKIGPASDVYSLGALLFELLTAQPPFAGTSTFETINRVCTLDPPKPRQLNPAVDRDLQAICLKCLQKQPRDRYLSAHDLAEDLGRYLRGEQILARPIGATRRLWRYCKQNRRIAALLLIEVVLLSVLVIRDIRVAYEGGDFNAILELIRSFAPDPRK